MNTATDPAEWCQHYAVLLLAQEDISNDYVPVAANVEIPTTFEWGDAWRWKDGITIDHQAAVEITKQRLRLERVEQLEAQDVAFMKALEEGKDTSSIIAEKNRLRDITKLADQATTLDELKSIIV